MESSITLQTKCYNPSKTKEDRIKQIMIMAKYYANILSDDPTTKVGAIFIDDNFQILSIGCNHSPYKMDFNHKDNILVNKYLRDNIIPNTKPLQKKKYPYIEHAERNAIFNATNNHISLKDSICITTLVPCIECTKAIIAVGTKEIYTFSPDGSSIWSELYNKSKELLDMSNISSTIVKISKNDLELINIGLCGWEDKFLNNIVKGGSKINKTRKSKKLNK